LPVEAQPPNILHDGINIFLLFPGGIGVVETQVTEAVVIVGQTKIQAYRLGMSYMQISVWFRGETRMHTAIVLVIADILFYDAFNEVQRLADFFAFFVMIHAVRRLNRWAKIRKVNDTGYWILDTGYWMLDAGCWIPIQPIQLIQLTTNTSKVYFRLNPCILHQTNSHVPSTGRGCKFQCVRASRAP